MTVQAFHEQTYFKEARGGQKHLRTKLQKHIKSEQFFAQKHANLSSLDGGRERIVPPDAHEAFALKPKKCIKHLVREMLM